MIQRLSHKHSDEYIQVSFDYSKDLTPGELVTSVLYLTVIVEEGTDAGPSSILNGAYVVQSPFVIQPAKLGLDGVDYHLSCLVQTDKGNRFRRQAILPVRSRP